MASSSLHSCMVFGDLELETVNKEDLQFSQARSVLGPDEGPGDGQEATFTPLPCLTPCRSLPSWS